MSEDSLKKELEEIKKMIIRMDHMIRGNGTPGIATRLSVLESKNRQSTQWVNLIVSILAAVAAILAAMK